MALFAHPPFADWIGKTELIDGEITRMSPSNIPHWRVQQEVAQQLQSLFARGDRHWLVGTEPTVRFAPKTVRLPDIGVFRYTGDGSGIFDVADLFLAVEIADTTLRHDLGRKRAAYARAGVPNFWVVDVNGRRTHVFTGPHDGAFAGESQIGFGEPLVVPGTDATITLA